MHLCEVLKIAAKNTPSELQLTVSMIMNISLCICVCVCVSG